MAIPIFPLYENRVITACYSGYFKLSILSELGYYVYCDGHCMSSVLFTFEKIDLFANHVKVVPSFCWCRQLGITNSILIIEYTKPSAGRTAEHTFMTVLHKMDICGASNV